MSDEPRAFVHEVDGQLVLEDPDAVAVFCAVEKHNCVVTAKAQADRIRHFIGAAIFVNVISSGSTGPTS